MVNFFNKKVLVSISFLAFFLGVAVLFQNCSDSYQGGFSSLEAKNASSSSGGRNIASTSNGSSNSASNFPMEEYVGNSNSTANSSGEFIFTDASYGDSSKALRQVQKIIGAKTSLLKACTGPTSGFSSTTCSQDSEFSYIKDAHGWQYDSLADIYSVDIDVSQFGWPNTTYTSVILFPNGVKKQISFKPLVYEDTSYGNGSVVVRQRSKLVGFGKDLKGCANPSFNIHKSCALEKDFAFIKNAEGWSYNEQTDTYTVDLDVSGKGYPQTNYFTRLLTSSGKRFTVFKEVTTGASSSSSSGASAGNSNSTSSSSGGLKWVYTQVNSCIGPTPPPAPIGQPCSSYGQTATNACGTATCKY